ncbi:hypothetical protein MBLNU230_g4622t1 [Neophaeotheca triangularis]
MPMKSNKFDYTNRPNSGPKLGEIIGNALRKEAEKHLKAAQKQAGKSRKVSNVSAGTEHDDTTPKNHAAHLIDLKAPSKNLEDVGVVALCEGLEKALTCGDQPFFALEDLNLSNNDITPAALPKLARIITLAGRDIRTLDLSANNIHVSSPADAAAWSTFLCSFNYCQGLRRLDLSGNKLGSQALEILARIHVRQIDPTFQAPDDLRPKTRQSPELSSETMGSPPKSAGSSEQELERYAAEGIAIQGHAGLRSLPFINITKTAMTDAGALWLSYLLVNHPYPVQLMNVASETSFDSTFQVHHQGEPNNGVAWLCAENSKLSRDGIGLLKKAEAVRKDFFVPEDLELEEEHTTHTDKRRDSRATRGSRRVSYVNVPEEGLKSLRNRVQRSVIAHDGASAVGLWSAALQIIKCSRTLLALVPTTRRFYTGETLVKTKLDPPSTASAEDMGRPALPSAGAHARTPSSTAAGLSKVFIDSQHEAGKGKRQSYATTLAISTKSSKDDSSSNSVAITEVTNSPRTPKLVLAHRKGAFSEGTDLSAATAKLQKLTLDKRDEEVASEPWIGFQKSVLAEWPYQDLENVTHLPLGLLRTIMVQSIGDCVELLSDEQFKKAVEWGLDRGTLAAEREWVKFDESNQIWHLLEKVDCLAY